MLTVTDLQFIRENLDADLPRLLLSAHRYPEVQVPYAVAQIEAFRKVRHKIPTWFRFDLLMPPALSVEQASSEAAARFKASLFAGNSVLDLTGGMGVDAWFFSKNFKQVRYIEQNPELVRTARHNFDVLGARNINAEQADSLKFLQHSSETFDLIYLDPGRRTGQQGRVFQLADCQPNVLEIKAELLKKTERVLLKTAPLLDLWQAARELETVGRIWVISVGGECKEVLYLLEKTAPAIDNIRVEAVCLGEHESTLGFTRAEEQAAAVQFSPPLRYLYEPDAAILKAGAFNTFARQYSLLKLHPNTHLYTSESFVPNVPGRAFLVEAVVHYNRKAIRALLPEGRANIATRNFPDSPEQMRKKLGLADGGDWFVYGATDCTGRKIAILSRRVFENPE